MKQGKQFDLAIGIDPGTNTGIAIWDIHEKKFLAIDTVKIHQALMLILAYMNEHRILIRIEDPNLRTWFGHDSRNKLQGAGSIKRDFAIWADFLEEHGIEMEKLHPKNIMTKMKADAFKSLTGWDKRINDHARDAAMMVFQYE